MDLTQGGVALVSDMCPDPGIPDNGRRAGSDFRQCPEKNSKEAMSWGCEQFHAQKSLRHSHAACAGEHWKPTC
ncbi:CUB and sushi domain-containing protein 1 [Cricetulus griseus]|nr:CUB and sushi domain-containing protein 1 [Cricetulus griseus]